MAKSYAYTADTTTGFARNLVVETDSTAGTQSVIAVAISVGRAQDIANALNAAQP